MTTIKHHTSHSHHVTFHRSITYRQWSRISHTQSVSSPLILSRLVSSHLGTESTLCHNNSNTADDNCRVIYIFPLRIVLAYKHFFHLHKCLRPYHREYTGSRLITEVKPGRAGLVLGWVTAWEYPVS